VLNRNNKKIGYSILRLDNPGHQSDELWSDFDFLEFPTQIRPVGMQVITLKLGTTVVAATDSPFQVVSDANYVYVFRRSSAGTLLVDRFVLDAVMMRLVPTWEVRYRRSQKVDLPADRKDSFGTTNMEGERFVEATTELTMIGNIQGAGFAVQIMPTDVASVERWLILAWNSNTKNLDVWSIRRSGNGLFDLADTINANGQVLPSATLHPADTSRSFATGPAALYYHRQEWLKDEHGTKRLYDRTARVMVAIPSGTDNKIAVLDFAAGKDGRIAAVNGALPIASAPAPTTAIALDGNHQTAITVPALSLGTQAVTFECWVRAGANPSGCRPIMQSATGALALLLAVVDGAPVFQATAGGTTLTAAGPALELGDWTHLAGVRDGSSATLYVNGQPYTTTATITAPNPPAVGYRFGGPNGFTGALKEARLWNVARTRADILAAMTGTIASNDPAWNNLVGYWKMDEPADATRLTTVPNSAATGAAGEGTLAGALWVAANAPTSVSMRPVAWDANDLDVSTCLLDFAASEAIPCLYESSDGGVGLYLKQATTGNLVACHFDTRNTRARYSVPWVATAVNHDDDSQRGVIHFIARTPGTGMIDTQLSPSFVEIVPNSVIAPALPTATVTLRSNTGVVETWPLVPLELNAMTKVINGGALQTSADPVAAGRDALMYDYTAVAVTHGAVQHGITPGPGSGSGIFGALPETTPTNGYPGIVSGTAGGLLPILSRAGGDSWWLPAPPRAALSLSGGYVQVLDAAGIGSYHGPLLLRRDLTMEAWLNPAGNIPTQATVMVFNSPSAKCNYVLGLDDYRHLFAGNDKKLVRVADFTNMVPINTWTHVAATYKTDYGIQLSGTKYLDVGNDTSLDAPDAFTIEGWVKLDQAGTRQAIAGKATTSDRTWELYIDGSGAPVFEVRQIQGTGTAISTVTGGTTFAAGAWHHVAGVYDAAFKRETVLQFNVATAGYVTIPPLATPIATSFSVEVWVQVTSQSVAPGALQGIIQSTNPNDPVSLSLYLNQNIPTFNLNNNPSLMAAGTVLRIGDWVHLAGTYDAVAGKLNLYVNGRSVGSLGKVLQPGGPPVTSGYRVGASTLINTAFGGLLSDLRLWNRALSVDEVRNNMMHSLTGGERGLVGYWPFNDRFGTTVMDLAGSSPGTISNATFIQSDKGFFNQRILVDGAVVGNAKVTAPAATSEAPLSLGASGGADFLQGTLGDVRLWKVGRLDWEINAYRLATIPRNAEGLISEWPFSTGKGTVAFDSKSDNNAIFRDTTAKMTDAIADTLWVPTAFKAAWRLYINGQEVASSSLRPPTAFDTAQCLIGAEASNSPGLVSWYGTLAELRLWNQVRTGEQIRDSMYAPLAGNEDHLAAYWPMNDGSGVVIANRTGSGDDGTWQRDFGGSTPAWVTSSAPVGIEAPQVQSLPGGISNAGLQATISDTPAVGDYPDVELSAEGGNVAAMKRGYAYVSTAVLNAVTGYKTGDLFMQYIGQVQTAPTLIGYIEGAPPLASENLTVDSPITPYKYLAASAITLTEADETTVSYSAERDRGDDVSLDYKIGLALAAEIDAGFLVQSLVWKVEGSAGFRTTTEKALATLSGASISNTTGATTSKTIEVFGAWQQNTYTFDPLVQRLYIPNNMGYALVKSGTADYFAIRLKTTGAVVKYTAQPNPDIPEDTNIIMFKIDPIYIKNGTLDGYVGFQPDRDYGFLTGGAKGSFFKPIEAYALKQGVEREQQQLLAAYDQFDATGLGRRFETQLMNSSSPMPAGKDIGASDADLTGILLQMQGGGTATSREWKERLARRNLVNTYVWNSDGGLYSEEEQFSAVHEESLGGSYDIVTKYGLFAELKMSIGIYTSMDGLFGTHLRTRAMKQKTEGKSFGLSVKLPGEGFLNKRATPGTMPPGEYPVAYEAFSCPGKVNQYRFMTFYLAPKKSNFETFWSKTVDQNWLNRQGPYVGTDDPDAFALRQARANPNDVWRVLHRVTYVNRIPPAKGVAESIPEDARRPDEQSVALNIGLITDLPVLQGDPAPIGTIFKELQPLLTQLAGNPVWGALLTAQRATVTDDIMEYMRSYHQVPR
jgi:hypothetical protein